MGEWGNEPKLIYHMFAPKRRNGGDFCVIFFNQAAKPRLCVELTLTLTCQILVTFIYKERGVPENPEWRDFG
jgi:hypothetical protein